jgi:hypothetical protein
MATEAFTASASGVMVADDFRSNLIIDRYDPIFSGMRASKLKHLRSENSEDAVTWNVFRTLRQMQPGTWLPALSKHGLGGRSLSKPDSVVVTLWRNVPPPPSLLELGDEGISEIDVVLEHPEWVWFIEAKYHSDISTGTTTRPLRNQVLRNIDVGSYYAGVRPFFFSLLVRSRDRSPVGASTVEQYASLSLPRSELSGHRPDGLQNLQAVTLLTWADLGVVLTHARAAAVREDEQGYADRAIEWLSKKGLHSGA